MIGVLLGGIMALATSEGAPSASAARGLPVLDTTCDGADLFGGTQAEKGGWCLLREYRYAGLRTVAERALEEDPESYRAHVLAGLAHHLGEANLPRALNLHKRAEQLILRQEGRTIQAESPAWFAARINLLELIGLCAEMNLHAEQIAYVDVLRDRMAVNMSALKAWPYIKMRDFDRARSVALEAAAMTGDDNRDQRRDGLTALCAVESELQHREEAYAACTAAAREHMAEGDTEGGVALVNLAIASGEVLKFDQAERWLLEATRRSVESTINPWGSLAHLYMRQGRMAEALTALREMHRYRAQRPPHMAQQDQAQADMVGATLLLLAGRTAEALRITRRVVDQPERLAASSARAEQSDAASRLVDLVALQEMARRHREEASWSPWRAALRAHAEALLLDAQAWIQARTAARLLSDEQILVASLRPDCPGAVELPSWMRGTITSVVGPGVASAAIARGRSVETLPPEQAGPYFDAYEAEARWRAGDDAGALELAQRARTTLGRPELLLRARVAVVGSSAATALGRVDDALPFLSDALAVDAGMFRRLGGRVPVRLEDDGSAVAARARAWLADSPLLQHQDAGLVLRLSPAAVLLEMPDGSEVLSAEVPAGNDDDEEDAARRIARAVHERLLVARLDVTQADVRSLDGAVGGGARLHEQTEHLLEQVLKVPARTR